MNTSSQFLPGIKRIFCIPCSSIIPNVALRNIAKMASPILTKPSEIQFFGVPTCSATTEQDNRQSKMSATLKFKSAWSPCSYPLAFIIEDVNGGLSLMGAKEPPFPSVKQTSNSGSPSGDPAGFSYEITHIALKTLCPCVMFNDEK
jgi:hypothetical protein